MVYRRTSHVGLARDNIQFSAAKRSLANPSRFLKSVQSISTPSLDKRRSNGLRHDAPIVTDLPTSGVSRRAQRSRSIRIVPTLTEMVTTSRKAPAGGGPQRPAAPVVGLPYAEWRLRSASFGIDAEQLSHFR
jgi:hypothetical protein